MKTTSLLALSMLICSASFIGAQDPKFREAEKPRLAAAPATLSAPATDDSSRSADRMNDMLNLDDTRPLRFGDRISFRVVEDKEKTQSLLVQASGDIQAPYLGLVKSSGVTCKKLAFQVKARLEQSYFQSATVIIALEMPALERDKVPGGTNPDFFTVFGQVGRQGRYEMLQDEEVTLSAAVLKAGGPTQFARTSKVRIIRKTPSGNKEIMVNLDDVMKKGKMEKDIAIRPNDVIILPEKFINF